MASTSCAAASPRPRRRRGPPPSSACIPWSPTSGSPRAPGRGGQGWHRPQAPPRRRHEPPSASILLLQDPLSLSPRQLKLCGRLPPGTAPRTHPMAWTGVNRYRGWGPSATPGEPKSEAASYSLTSPTMESRSVSWSSPESARPGLTAEDRWAGPVTIGGNRASGELATQASSRTERSSRACTRACHWRRSVARAGCG